MYIGIIGLGKMGEAIAYRLRQKNISVFGVDLSKELCDQAASFGVVICATIEELVEKSDIVWIMVPVTAVNSIVLSISKYDKKKLIVIDGGNSKFSDSIQHAQLLNKVGMHFLDCGTSGGVWGRERGFCLMVGGEKAIFEKVKPFFDGIAAPNAVLYTGPSGSGHYVKMIHNGIEYGIMQSYAEGFHLLHDGQFKGKLDLEKIATVWNNGSVIRSWLLELSEQIFKEQKNFDSVSGYAAESGMGKWTIEEAVRSKIPVQAIEAAYQVRLESQKTGGNFATKIIALLRNKFGGHVVKKVEK